MGNYDGVTFDGDEMNMHVPQSLQTHEELRQLAAVPTQIISPRECKPIVSIVQDIALGVYRITKDNIRLSDKQFYNMLATNPKFSGIIPKPDVVENNVSKWTGRQLLSTIIPPKVNVDMRTSQYDETKSKEQNKNHIVSIQNGIVKSGTFDKDVYQSRTKGIIHSIFNEYGPEETRLFFDNTQKLICNFLVQNGFSVGISDLIIDEKTVVQFQEIIRQMKVDVYNIISKIHHGSFENTSTKSNTEFFEREVNSLLNQANKNVGEMGLSQIDESVNRLINMIKSKSKGNTINVAQMIGCLGQQNVDGRRIPYGFDDRTLPHYAKYDDGPESRGFVENSFINGLTPQEFFFHAMGGREGLIDTAVQSVTGDTPIIILEDGIPKYVRIGDWIDNHLELAKDKVRHFTERRMELLDMTNDIYIPTTDEHGNITWGQVTAMTRHDPGTELYKVTTRGGKEVIVTESKSLLTWHPTLGQFKEVPTPEIKVGDFVPVTANLMKPPVIITYIGETSNKLELNHQSGVVIGLYTALGSYSDSYTTIIDLFTGKNNDELIEILTKYIYTIKHKEVPDFAFCASEEFIVGFLNGFFSVKGDIYEHSIVYNDTRLRLLEGISMLCSRINVFGSITPENNEYKFEITSKWANLFSNKVNLVSSTKDKQLKEAKFSAEHCNFKLHNDVVLDEIINIDIIDAKLYPKVYDLTIPSTLNFGLANGLQVRDTSETGYIQRKLVKAMEDCKVNHDMSIRNAAGSIIQFLYGEDGMDAIKIESQSIPYIDMDSEKLEAEYNFSESLEELKLILDKDTYKRVSTSKKSWIPKMQDHIMQLQHDRDHVITMVFKNKMETSVMYPVSFNRIINNTKGLYSKFGANVALDLEPSYILEKIDELCETLFVNRNHKGNRLFQILARVYLSPKQILIKHKIPKDGFDYIISQIKFRFFDSLAHPSEMVGVIAAQSLGEPATQLTLNSVHYDTSMLLRVNGTLERTSIGDFIESHLANIKQDDLEQHPNDTWLGWIKDKNVEVLSCDKNGRVLWSKVEAVTKHPVINEDGSNTLLKVTLKSGRDVIATKAKSFLQRVDNQIVQVEGKHIKVGDRIPVSKLFETSSKLESFDVSKYLSKKEYLFMSEVEKAKQFVNENHWWMKHNNKSFILPYSRSDSFINTHINKNVCQLYQTNCVYPKVAKKTVSTIPENISLDEDFGFFVGAYLAEGHATKQHVLIANIDETYLERINTFCKKYNIKHHTKTRYINNETSTTIRLHSVVLANLMRNAFGHLSFNKNIPAELLDANDKFLKNMIDGYISGDGSIRKSGAEVKCDSTSKSLLESLQQIFVKFNILSVIHEHRNNQTILKNTLRKSYTLLITSNNAHKFASQFTLTIDSKQARLQNILSRSKPLFSYGRNDIIPNVKLSSGEENIHRDDVPLLMKQTSSDKDKQILNNILNEDIIYDEIIKIEEIPNNKDYVYDLTVEGTRNFNTFTGICMADTFHMSGVSSASKTVRGVPRLKELLNVTKNIKTPAMKIFFKPEDAMDRKRCKEIMNDIRTIRFKDIVESTKIFFDPDDFNSNIEDDKEFITLYRDFVDEEQENTQLSPWLLRMEFNKAKMHEYNVDMGTLHQKLIDFYSEDSINCMFNDDNAQKLIFRIKLVMNETSAEDVLTDLKALEHNIMENIIIKGTKNIEKVSLDTDKHLKYNPITRKFEKCDEYLVYTDGTNLKEVLAMKNIDSTRTITNDVTEIYETLGVEAARQALFNEISEVLDSIVVNYRHISLLVDVQTNKGYLLSIDRHGINRGDIGPLAKCSFEETTDKLIKAGIFAEYDKINGVSANIMLGQVAPCGTGDTEILIDEDKLMNIKLQTIQEDQPMMDNDDEVIETICEGDALGIDFELPDVPLLTKESDHINKLVIV